MEIQLHFIYVDIIIHLSHIINQIMYVKCVPITWTKHQKWERVWYHGHTRYQSLCTNSMETNLHMFVFIWALFVTSAEWMAKVMFDLCWLVSGSVCLSVCLSLCMSVWVSVYLLSILRETHEWILIIFKIDPAWNMEHSGTLSDRLFHACLNRFRLLKLGAVEVCPLGMLLVWFFSLSFEPKYVWNTTYDI